MEVVKKVGGFWIKFLSRGIDMLILMAFILGSGVVSLDANHNWEFYTPWKFYVWILISIMAILFFSFVLPVVSKGKTIGMRIFKLEFVCKNKLPNSVIKREFIYSGIWIINLLLLAFLINHKMINTYIKGSAHKFTGLDAFRVSIVGTIGSVSVTVQMVFAISTIIRSDNNALHDVIAKTSIVYKNKFVEIKDKNKIGIKLEKLKPKLIEKVEIKWI